MHRRGVILGLTRAVVFPSPIAIILLVPLMRIGVHAMAIVGGRYASLLNLKAYIVGGVIEESGNV